MGSRIGSFTKGFEWKNNGEGARNCDLNRTSDDTLVNIYQHIQIEPNLEDTWNITRVTEVDLLAALKFRFGTTRNIALM